MFGNEKEIAQAYETALKLEIEGFEFYIECSKKTKDENTSKFFMALSDEEKTHYAVVEQMFEKNLLGLYQEYIQKYKGDYFQSGIFNEPKNESIQNFNLEKALTLAIEAEQKSIQLYENFLVETIDPEISEVFQKIIHEEENHISLLQKKLDELQGK